MSDDIREYFTESLIKANILAARESGDKDPYWDELEEKLEGKRPWTN